MSDSKTTTEIKAALVKRFAPKPGGMEEWAFFLELPTSTGMGIRTMDGFAFNLWKGDPPYLTQAFEIKVSRTDFLSEIKHPPKREPAMKLADEFYFVAPKGLIETHELPEDCGLMELYEGSFRIKLRPRRKEKRDELPRGFMASIARRVCRLERVTE